MVYKTLYVSFSPLLKGLLVATKKCIYCFAIILFLAKMSGAFAGSPGIQSIFTTLTRFSDGISGQQGNGKSEKFSFSNDGRYAVFESTSSNLVSGDANGLSDVFLYDFQNSSMTRLSVGLSGAQANGPSFDAKISGDGNYAVFSSFANNLVSGDTNNTADVFRVTLSTGAITRISVNSNGTEGNGASGEPSISNDGNIITFTSLATNLVASDTNEVRDVFLRNVSSGTTTRVSVNSSGIEGNHASYGSKISGDGAFVVFVSDAINLVTSDTNSCSDVFRRNLSSATTQLVSSSSNGTLGNSGSDSPDISENGQYIVFQSRANNLISSDTNGYIDVFMKDMSSGVTTLISQTNSGSQVKYDSARPSISGDGRFVVFESRSSGYVPWDSNGKMDVFIRDIQSELTTPFSTLSGDVIGNGKSIGARISGNGSKIGFESLSTNFVTSDNNAQWDLFARANPLVGEVVNITPISDLTESGSSQNAFSVIRYGDLSQALTVYYSVSGTATSGVDYSALSGSVTIPAYSSSIIIAVTPISDTTVEADESITLTLVEDAAYIIGGKNAATVKILNDDDFIVSVSVTENVATEDGVMRGNFRISRAGGTMGDLIVNIGVNGTATPGVDYVALPSAAMIPAGQVSVDVQVIGIEDNTAAYDKSITLSILSGSGYSAGTVSSGTVTLKDNDRYTVNINAIDTVLDKSNLSNTGTFRIDRGVASAESLEVKYALKGTAQNGVDYQTLSGTATIAPNNQYVDVTVTALANLLNEGYKSIVVELLGGGIYSLGPSQEATLTIKVDSILPVVSIETTDAVACEDGTDTANFRVTRAGSTTTPLVVHYSIGGNARNGVDYATLSGVATIGVGQSFVDIVLTGIEDSLVEGTQTVILALQSSSDYLVDVVNSQAQAIINDNETPIVQIFRESTFSSKNQNTKGRVRVSRDGDLSAALTVNLSFSGTAASGVDYENPGSTVIIPAGERSRIVEISAIQNGMIEGNKSLIITVGSSASYSVGFSSWTEIVVLDKTYKVFEELLGIMPNADVSSVSVSDDGRFLVFATEASNLVSGDNNGKSDVFIADTTNKTIMRIMAPGGVEPNGASRNPKISADGNYIVFSSSASNLYQYDYNGHEDVFLYNRINQAITYISQGVTYLAQGGNSINPSISSNGNYIVFESEATNLVYDDTNGVSDIFEYERSNGILKRVSLKPNGVEFSKGSHRPTVSNDGSLIAFESTESVDDDSDSFSDIILRNQLVDSVTRVSTPVTGTKNDGPSNHAFVNAEGSAVVFQSGSAKLVLGDLNGASDIFRYSVGTRTKEIVSKSFSGLLGDRASSNPTVEATGDNVLFLSSSRNFGGSFNCTTSAYIKSLGQKKVYSIENTPKASCSNPIREAVLSNSGKFVVSVVASIQGFREIAISANPLM